jgi:hypothetical protein
MVTKVTMASADSPIPWPTKNTVIYFLDLHFFLNKLHRCMPSRGMFIQRLKTRILTSPNSESAIPAIIQVFGPSIANKVQEAIATFSVKPAPTDTDPSTTVPC